MRVLLLLALFLTACAPHRRVKFAFDRGGESCQGTVDEGPDGCQLRYVSTERGATSLSSFRAAMRCGQHTVVCGRPVRCNCL